MTDCFRSVFLSSFERVKNNSQRILRIKFKVNKKASKPQNNRIIIILSPRKVLQENNTDVLSICLTQGLQNKPGVALLSHY